MNISIPAIPVSGPSAAEGGTSTGYELAGGGFAAWKRAFEDAKAGGRALRIVD